MAEHATNVVPFDDQWNWLCACGQHGGPYDTRDEAMLDADWHFRNETEVEALS